MGEPPLIGIVNETLRSRRLRALVRYWNEKRGKRDMPCRAEIDPIEIAGLLPIALIADTRDGPARIRLIGSETTDAYGRELRGLTIDQIEFGDFTPRWREAFGQVIASTAPVAAAGTFRAPPELRSVEVALMPMAGDDGVPAFIFGGMVIRQIARGIVRSSAKPTPAGRNGSLPLNSKRAQIASL
jgi:hypothetical protein